MPSLPLRVLILVMPSGLGCVTSQSTHSLPLFTCLHMASLVLSVLVSKPPFPYWAAKCVFISGHLSRVEMTNIL